MGKKSSRRHWSQPDAGHENVNSRINRYGHTGLIWASSGGGRNLNKVKKLLRQRGIDVNMGDWTYGNTALMMACGWCDIEIVEQLLKHPDIDVNKARTSDGKTALDIAKQFDMIAPMSGYAEIVRLLERAW